MNKRIWFYSFVGRLFVLSLKWDVPFARDSGGHFLDVGFPRLPLMPAHHLYHRIQTTHYEVGDAPRSYANGVVPGTAPHHQKNGCNLSVN
eukprot:3452716-Rhodomonas_salina.1